MSGDKYYKGFEGEPQIVFQTQPDGMKLVVWNGYFETLLERMLDQGIPPQGILGTFVEQSGWYDKSPWEIKNINAAVQQFKMVRVEQLRDAHALELTADLQGLLGQLIAFLEETALKKQRVFIVYE